MAIKKSRFLLLLALFGLIMLMIGLLLGVRMDLNGAGQADSALSAIEGATSAIGGEISDKTSDQTSGGTSDKTGAQAADESGADDDKKKDKPIALSQLMFNANPPELPEALQAGQFADAASADALLQRLHNADFKARTVESIDDNGQSWYLVVLDEFETQAQLQQAQYQLLDTLRISARRIDKAGLSAPAAAQ